MATFSVRVDDSTKQSFDRFCEASGMSISTAINIFMKAVVKKNKIPFEITGEEDPFWSPENQAFLRQQIKEAKAGKVTEHELYGDDL